MSAAENKEIVRKMGQGGLDGMLATLADDVRWTIIGTTKFSGTYNGKKDVVDRLIKPLFAQLETPGSNATDNVIAEGDYVVLQSRGTGRKAKSGKSYNNTYCIVYKLANGKIQEIMEYCDTELITDAFGR
jgi:ketosteroid isomerase-like protein